MSADRRPLIHAVCAWRLGIAFAAAGLALPPAAADPPAGERWINIDGAPGWVAGTPVDQKLKSDWRGTRLKPGGYVALRVPARADLRLVTPAGALNADDLEIAVSNGSGMYRVVPTPQPNSGGHLVLTRTLRERLVRIDRPQHRTEPLTVAAFVNLRDLPTTLQQRVSPINGTPVRLRWYQQSSDVEYWPIGAGHRGELTVEGPTRILVDTIVAVSEDREETHSGYRVYARFDDHPPEPIEFAIRLSSRRALIDGRERVLGRRQATQLTVPAGRHRLFLHADAEVYARVSVQTPDDFLLPVNAPPRVPPEPDIAPGSHWDLTENDIQTWAQGARAQRERAALRLARDNHRRGGGLLAAQLLEQSALA
ncbi:MAG: hypothetical protein OEQ18_13295, partial [Gammaproteobacteria bacterium]|nr:hypothetical protein [Gammaproteobacteria bacterium]